MSDGDGLPVCACGHTSRWHNAVGARNGFGECEHDGQCQCKAFVPAVADVAEAFALTGNRRVQPWHYISFADDTGFLGGVYVRGSTLQAALLRATVLGINPGGEAAIIGPIPPEDLADVPESDRERLLTVREVQG